MDKDNMKSKSIDKFMEEYLQNEQKYREKSAREDLVVNFDIVYPNGKNETIVCGSQSDVFGYDGGCINTKVEPEEMKCYCNHINIDMIPECEDVIECKVDKNYEKDNCCKVDKNYEKDNCCKEDKKYKEDICCKLEDNYEDSSYCKMKNHYVEDIDCNLDNNKDYDYDCPDISTKEFYYCNSKYDYEGKWANCEEEITEKCPFDCYDAPKERKEKKVNGEIIVYSTLDTIQGTKIKGVKVNLYKINGICPELVASSVTDCDGKVVFFNIPEGNYRVIELIDRKYFNKPAYVNWNEVRVDCNNDKFTIYAINTVNKNCINRCR